MNSILTTAGLFIILSLAHDCGRTSGPLRAADYVEWVENADNGLFVSKTIGAMKFDLQFDPLEYRVLRENAGVPVHKAEMDVQKSAIRDMQYFTLHISETGGGDLLRQNASSTQDFSRRLAYFSSGMQHDIRLIEGKDTLDCLLFHYERAYGVDPRSTFVLGFPLGSGDGDGGLPAVSDKIFFFNDQELGAGPVLIALDAKNLALLPILNLE